MSLTRNTYSGALNLDAAPNLVSNNEYVNAFNVSITEDGQYGSLVPLKGDVNLGTLVNFSSEYGQSTALNSNVNVMGCFPCNLKTASGTKEGALIFIGRDDVGLSSGNYVFEIWAVVLGNASMTHTLIYTEPSVASIITATVDGIVSGDNGIDVMYFTDQINPMRKIRCATDEGVFTSSEITLQRQGVVLGANNVQLNSGGNLLSGSYQFAYRLINDTNNSYTKWSLFSKPVNVHTESSSALRGEGGVNHTSDQKADISFIIPSRLQNLYTHYQLAVIKNTTGSGIPKLVASIVDPKELVSASSISAEYIGDEEEEEVPVSEVTIDDAGIESVGTMTVKSNRLLAGNIEYVDLQYDRGEVTVSSSNTVTVTTTQGGPGGNNLIGRRANLNRSYFRDEVYRFYISYYDDFGNYSQPQVIDFSSVTENNASSGVKDFKFPDRGNGRGKLFGADLTDGLDPKGLGLRIADITNHPTWAKGFVVLQAKRKRNIQFQTPLIPTMIVEPALALDEYPQSGTPATADAQPPDPLGTLVPKNFRHGIPKHIARVGDDCFYFYDYPTRAVLSPGFTELQCPAAQYVHMVFPPNNMYNHSGETYEAYAHNKSDAIDVVDAVLFRKNNEQFDENTNSFNSMDYADNIEATTLAALDREQYYYTYNSTDITNFSFANSGSKINEYGEISSSDSEYIITTPVPYLKCKRFGAYSSLDPSGGLVEGSTPGQQKAGIIVTEDPIIDPTYKSFTGTSSDSTLVDSDITWVPFNNINTSQLDTSGPDLMVDNDEVTSNFLGCSWIVNVTKGLDDSRYGSDNDYHEIYHTGVTVELTSAEVASNTPKTVTLYAGDAFVTQHTFKVSDSTYSLTSGASPGDDADNLSKWGHQFTTGSREVQRPIPLSGHGQTISLFLESEIDSVHADKLNNLDTTAIGTGSNHVPIPNGAGDIRIPFSYEYNLDNSLPNSTKVFPAPVSLDNTNKVYKSRIAYSDTRVYQTREVGFDRFRVLNFFDLEESKGSITKLLNSQDNIYAIQEDSVAYVPVEANVLETQDANTLAVRSDDIIGNPRYLSTKSGSKSIRSIVTTPGGFIYADVDNRDIIQVSGFESQNISSNKVQSFFNDVLSKYTDIGTGGVPLRSLSGYYDLDRKEYLLFSQFSSNLNSYVIVYNEEAQAWTTKIAQSATSDIHGGFYSDSGLIMVGQFSGEQLTVRRMYQDDFDNSILGQDDPSSVTFIVNPEGPIAKVFDVYTIESTGQLATVSAGHGGINIDSTMRREGTDRVTSVRGEGNQRIRGQFNEVTLTWKDNDFSRLTSVTTQYRPSDRRI